MEGCQMEINNLEVKQIEKKEKNKGDEDRTTKYTTVLANDEEGIRITISSDNMLNVAPPKTKGLSVIIRSPQKTLAQ